MECMLSTTQQECSGGATEWQEKWIRALVAFPQLYYNCKRNIGLFCSSSSSFSLALLQLHPQ